MVSCPLWEAACKSVPQNGRHWKTGWQSQMVVNGKQGWVNSSKPVLLQMCCWPVTRRSRTSVNMSIIQSFSSVITCRASMPCPCVPTTWWLLHPSSQRNTSEEPRNLGSFSKTKMGLGTLYTQTRKCDDKMEASRLDAKGGPWTTTCPPELWASAAAFLPSLLYL